LLVDVLACTFFAWPIAPRRALSCVNDRDRASHDPSESNAATHSTVTAKPYWKR